MTNPPANPRKITTNSELNAAPLPIVETGGMPSYAQKRSPPAHDSLHSAICHFRAPVFSAFAKSPYTTNGFGGPPRRRRGGVWAKNRLFNTPFRQWQPVIPPKPNHFSCITGDGQNAGFPSKMTIRTQFGAINMATIGCVNFSQNSGRKTRPLHDCHLGGVGAGGEGTTKKRTAEQKSKNDDSNPTGTSRLFRRELL